MNKCSFTLASRNDSLNVSTPALDYGAPSRFKHQLRLMSDIKYRIDEHRNGKSGRSFDKYTALKV